MNLANTLFAEEKYKEAIGELNILLENDRNNINAYLLRAKAKYNFAFQQQQNELANMLMDEAIEDFSVVIAFDSLHAEALEYRAYILNQFVDDKNELLLSDAEKLISINNTNSKLKGFNYKALALRKLGKIDESISVFRNLIAFINEHFKKDLQQKDIQLSNVYLNIGDTYLLGKNDAQSCLIEYELAITHYPYNHNANFHIATTALQNNNYDLAGKAAYEYFGWLSYNESLDNGELFAALFDYLQAGNKNVNVAKAIAITIQTEPHNPFDNELDLFNYLKKVKDDYEENYFAAGALGNILYDNKDFVAANKYYEEALLHSEASPNWYAKWIIGYIKTNNKIPINIPLCKSTSALELFSGAVVLYEFLNDKKHSLEQDAFLRNEILKLYNKSYEIYTTYWFYNKGDAYSNNQHWYAMCCNNYGLFMDRMGMSHDAIPIFQTGYKLSPFWEQLASLSESQFNAELYNDTIETIDNLLDLFEYQIPLVQLLYIIDRYMHALEKTQQFNKLIKVADVYLEYKQDWLSQKMPPKDREEMERLFNIIYSRKTNIKHYNNEEDDILADYESQLENDPENREILYSLFQQYHIKGKYKKCIECANYYEKIELDRKFEGVTQLAIHTLHYRRGASYRMVGEFDKAIHDLEKAIPLDKNHYWPKHELAIAYLQNQDLKNAEKLAWFCINKYINDNHNWDVYIDELATNFMNIYLQNKDTKNAVKVAKFVLSKNEDHKIAIRVKKENTNWLGF